GPGEGRLRDPPLHRGNIDLASRGLGAHHHVYARMARAGDLHLTLDRLAGESLEHDLLDALAHLGVVAVARHIHQAGVEALVGIASRQQTDRAALVEIHDAAGDADQIIDARLKELITRIGLEHVEHGLAVVTVRIETKVLDHAIDFPPQHGDVTRAAVIGGRSPEAQEPVLTDDPPPG